MQVNNNTDLLGLKDLKTINVIEETREILIETEHIHEITCPYCGSNHNWIHDHRVQIIKDTPIRKKKVLLKVKKTRYDCKSCGKRFEVPLSFIGKSKQMTRRMVEYVAEAFSQVRSMSELVKEIGISVTTIFRIIDFLQIPRKPLAKVLCIDEFKGDSGNSKYQTTIADGEKRKLIDILPSRHLIDLKEYSKNIPLKERKNVEIFVSDMCRTFKSIKDLFFKDSIHVIDRYHYLRQVQWALENVRKREQNSMRSYGRKYFKRSKSLLKSQQAL